MKKSIYVIIILALAVLETAKAQDVQIRGRLKEFDNQVMIEDFSELQYLKNADPAYLVKPDSSGNFSVTLTVRSPNYFRIGRNVLYLTPGDNLMVIIDHKNPELSVFTGRGSAANNYLRFTPFPKGGSFIVAGKALKSDPVSTISFIHQAAAKRLAQLDTLSGVTTVFKQLEAARVRADVINSLLSVQYYYARSLKLKGDTAKAYLSTYNKLAIPEVKKESVNFADAGLLKLTIYRDIADQIILEPNERKADVQHIRDWIRSTELADQMQKINDKHLLVNFKDSIVAVHTTIYQNALYNMLKHLQAFGKGDQAIDFIATDSNGKPVALSSLKGKVIYIDLWATWCGPCMAEMPALNKLKALYEHNPGVVFLSLSIDDGAAAWKQSISQRKADGLQWLINRNKLNAYQVNTIPRTLLIGKDFSVVDLNAPLPSWPQTPVLINRLLNTN